MDRGRRVGVNLCRIPPMAGAMSSICGGCGEKMVDGMTFCWSCGGSAAGGPSSGGVAPTGSAGPAPRRGIGPTPANPTRGIHQPPPPHNSPPPGGNWPAPTGTTPLSPVIDPSPTTLAQWSYYAGFASLLCCFTAAGAFAIGLGALALWDIKRRNGMVGGRRQAITGIVLGSISFIVFLAVM